jgi:hypothetical protein
VKEAPECWVELGPCNQSHTGKKTDLDLVQMRARMIVWFGLVLYFDYVHYRTLDCGDYATGDDHIPGDVVEDALDSYVDLDG